MHCHRNPQAQGLRRHFQECGPYPDLDRPLPEPASRLPQVLGAGGNVVAADRPAAATQLVPAARPLGAAEQHPATMPDGHRSVGVSPLNRLRKICGTAVTLTPFLLPQCTVTGIRTASLCLCASVVQVFQAVRAAACRFAGSGLIQCTVTGIPGIPCFPLFSLMLLAACSQTPDPVPIGPRAEKFVGPERRLPIGWGKSVPEDSLLRKAIEQDLRRRGIAVAEVTGAAFVVISYTKEWDKEKFQKNPWRSVDFSGEKAEIIGDTQRCFVKVALSSEGKIISVLMTYEWNAKHIENNVVEKCIEFALNK